MVWAVVPGGTFGVAHPGSRLGIVPAELRRLQGFR
jgi:hypothetical protein